MGLTQGRAGLSVPFVGLTGGLGAGKSTALDALERLGAAVLSTDRVVHEIYEDPDVRDQAVERFGGEVAPGGRIDRSQVARRAFATREDREWLEALLWPRVRARMAQWRTDVQQASPTPRAAVVEVPLLFESGSEGLFDATIVVVADEQVRAERARARGHEAIDARAARQLSQEEKRARATYVVENDGTMDELLSKVSAVLVMLEGR